MSHLPNVYATINIADLPLIDFSQIGEDNENTIRKSLDETEFLIKWDDELMNTPAWSEDIGDLEDKRKIDKDVNNKENKA